MSIERLRTLLGDTANTAAVLSLVIGALGYLGLGRPLVAAGCASAAAAMFIGHAVLKPRRSLGPLELRALRRFFEREVDRCRQELPAGTTPESGITLSDFLSASLFAEPNVDVLRGPAVREGFVNWILDAVRRGDRTLVLGDPGQGKTLSCRIAYVRLAQECLRQSRRRTTVPLFVRLSDLRDHLTAISPGAGSTGGLAAFLTSGDDAVPLSAQRLAGLMRHRRVVLILDGLDELAIHGGTARDIVPAALDPAFRGRVVLSCRRAFYETYLSTLAAAQDFEALATLDGVDFATNGRYFIERYCDRFELDTADAIIGHVGRSRALKDLVTRPLTLFMTTDLLAHGLAGVPSVESSPAPEEWTVAEVYELYVRKWLNLEQQKGTVLWQDMEELCEAVAWRVFELAFDGRRPFGSFDVSELVINTTNLRAVVDDWHDKRPRHLTLSELTNRSFLIRTDVDGYFRFAHKSFFEFFVARRLRTMLTHRHDQNLPLIHHLAAPLPDEVVDFLRQMLHRCAGVTTDCSAIRNNLFQVLDASTALEQTDAVVMLRQQAGNLIPLVLADDPAGQAKLRALHERERHPFVRRGIAVGVALHLRDRTLIEHLVDDLTDDPEALSFHIGYNRIYYGDQEAGVSGWRDDGTPACDRFFAATLRQLENPFYKHVWPMSVRTARVLLEHDGRLAYLRAVTDLDRGLDRLDAFVRAYELDPWSVLTAEVAEMAKLVASLRGERARDDLD